MAKIQGKIKSLLYMNPVRDIIVMYTDMSEKKNGDFNIFRTVCENGNAVGKGRMSISNNFGRFAARSMNMVSVSYL